MLYLITDGTIHEELQPAMVVDVTDHDGHWEDELAALTVKFAKQAGVELSQVVVNRLHEPTQLGN